MKKAMRQKKTSCVSVQCLYVISEESADLETGTVRTICGSLLPIRNCELTEILNVNYISL